MEVYNTRSVSFYLFSDIRGLPHWFSVDDFKYQAHFLHVGCLYTQLSKREKLNRVVHHQTCTSVNPSYRFKKSL